MKLLPEDISAHLGADTQVFPYYERSPFLMAMNLTQKILSAHLLSGELIPG